MFSLKFVIAYLIPDVPAKVRENVRRQERLVDCVLGGKGLQAPEMTERTRKLLRGQLNDDDDVYGGGGVDSASEEEEEGRRKRAQRELSNGAIERMTGSHEREKERKKARKLKRQAKEKDKERRRRTRTLEDAEVGDSEL